jgi:hypothetical protein
MMMRRDKMSVAARWPCGVGLLLVNTFVCFSSKVYSSEGGNTFVTHAAHVWNRSATLRQATSKAKA